jgi:hypothetical protein
MNGDMKIEQREKDIRLPSLVIIIRHPYLFISILFLRKRGFSGGKTDLD